MARVFITRHIPEAGINRLREAGHEVDVSNKDGILTRDELLAALSQKPYDAVICLLTDKIDRDVFAAAPNSKIFANYAVGFDNVNLPDAAEHSVTITNTPGVLTDSVAEFTIALMMSVAKRIPEAMDYARAGRYEGWAPEMFLGLDMKKKVLAIIGAGRIGSEAARIAKYGLGMEIIYYDVAPNQNFETATGAKFYGSLEQLLPLADFISVHVPLLPQTRHLINAESLSLMKPSAVLINTSRGPVVDEAALATALSNGTIRAAGIDVFENEPAINETLRRLPNAVITPHIASATEETRTKMSLMAAENVIAFLGGQTPPNIVKLP